MFLFVGYWRIWPKGYEYNLARCVNGQESLVTTGDYSFCRQSHVYPDRDLFPSTVAAGVK